MAPYYIDHENAAEELKRHDMRNGNGHHAALPGCTPRVKAYGTIAGTSPAETFFPIIPRDEWEDRFNAGQGQTLRKLTRGVLPFHDQGSWNYCWMYGSVRTLEHLRIYEGQPPLLLSPQAAAYQLTGGRNRGGSPDEALEWLRDNGTCTEALWPDANGSIRLAQSGWKENARLHRITHWLDVRTIDEQVTLAFHDVPVAIGVAWWGHLIEQVGLARDRNGQIGLDIDNSWGSTWGDHGTAVLDLKHGTADLGAFAPLSATFSAE